MQLPISWGFLGDIEWSGKQLVITDWAAVDEFSDIERPYDCFFHTKDIFFVCSAEDQIRIAIIQNVYNQPEGRSLEGITACRDQG